jgi:hypothetical protein
MLEGFSVEDLHQWHIVEPLEALQHPLCTNSSALRDVGTVESLLKVHPPSRTTPPRETYLFREACRNYMVMVDPCRTLDGRTKRSSLERNERGNESVRYLALLSMFNASFQREKSK